VGKCNQTFGFALVSTKRKKTLYTLTGGLCIILLFLFLVPLPQFSDSYSTVLCDKNGLLLAAQVAPDGQWRFPPSQEVPDKFERAILLYEDKGFYNHFGISIKGMARATKTNWEKKKVVQGGSTITMQVARMAYQHSSRSLFNKLWEMIGAVKLELFQSKKSILEKYAAHAPFGGNVVGLEAAGWRFFGKKLDQITWAEAAMLAVLPNNPSLIHVGKNRELLLAKRNKLLARLHEANAFDQKDLRLFQSEPLPQQPFALPKMAHHAMHKLSNEGFKGKKVCSTIDFSLQTQCIEWQKRYQKALLANQIHNIAILVTENATGNVVAYVGNTEDDHKAFGNDVDMILAQRSYGSLLKPFVYAAMLNEGQILPHSLVPNIPTNIFGYRPQNYFKDFDGAVPAHQVLSRSINVPSVRLLHQYGVEKFLTFLRPWGFSTFNKSAEYYGLSLVLGGGESRLWEMVNAYRLLQQTAFQNPFIHSEMSLIMAPESRKVPFHPNIEPLTAWYTLEAISETKRPDDNGEWHDYFTGQKIAWKTGTSHGSRDAWSIGCSSLYTVGIWIGNADGEGRSGLTGIGTAAPLLFKIFQSLPPKNWNTMPIGRSKWMEICTESGFKAQVFCPKKEWMNLPQKAARSGFCPYHVQVFLNQEKTHLVNSSCYSLQKAKKDTLFVLPPVMEYFYDKHHPSKRKLPAWMTGCQHGAEEKNWQSIGIVYPENGSKIYIPTEINGKRGKVVLDAVNRNKNEALFWHLDRQFIAKTQLYHQLEVLVSPGFHELTVVNEKGESQRVRFEVLEKE
jgi:penicillin-binding protein 1C